MTSITDSLHVRTREHERSDRRTAAPEARPVAVPRRRSSNARVVRPPSTVAERYHQYLTGLVDRLFLAPDAPVCSVLFVGLEGGRDVALLAAGAAEMLASCVAGRICLVDANVVEPSLHQHYGIGNEEGLISALLHDAPITRHAHLLAQGHESSLWLVPAGTAGESAGTPAAWSSAFANPSSGGRMRELIAAFDFVVITTQSIGRQAVSSAIGGDVDGVVLVAEANVTTRPSVRDAAETLRAAGAHLLGTILHNRVFPIPEVLYRLL